MPCACSAAALHMLARFWESLQVELNGHYSAARLQELHAYCASRSHRRVAAVIVLTPLPSLAVIALIECLPLRPTQDGLAHSFNFWLRNVFMLTIATSCILEQVRFCIRHIPIRGEVAHSISLVGSAATVYVAYLLAGVIGYPLPFTILLNMTPWLFLVGLPLWLSLRATFRAHPEALRTVAKYALIIVCQLSLILVYSLYNAAFANVTGHWQLQLSLMLPLIKLAEKNLFARVLLPDIEDLKPEIVIFNVEVFNALFTAICMQQAASYLTTLMLIGIDFVQACLSLFDLRGKLKNLEATVPRAHNNQFSYFQSDLHSVLPGDQPPKQPSHPSKNQVAPAAPARHVETSEPTTESISVQRCLPAPPSCAITEEERRELCRTVLEVFYLAEFLLLIEFVEVVIPFVYCVYIYVLFHLPNRVFYPQLQDMTDARLINTMQNVIAYGVLELVSLVVFCWILKRKLGISPLHQLAFVLERQWRMVQSKLVLWTVFSLQTSIEHFGMDYTFKFAWMRAGAKSA